MILFLSTAFCDLVIHRSARGTRPVDTVDVAADVARDAVRGACRRAVAGSWRWRRWASAGPSGGRLVGGGCASGSCDEPTAEFNQRG